MAGTYSGHPKHHLISNVMLNCSVDKIHSVHAIKCNAAATGLATGIAMGFATGFAMGEFGQIKGTMFECDVLYLWSDEKDIRPEANEGGITDVKTERTFT